MHNITENPQPYEGWPAQLGGLSLLFTVKLFYDLKSGWVSGQEGGIHQMRRPPPAQIHLWTKKNP